MNTAILSAQRGQHRHRLRHSGQHGEARDEQLIQYGAVDRGQLGFNMYAVTPEVARSLGLHKAAGGLVEQVIPGSPAERAGVRAGDVVTAIAGHRIKSNTDLRGAIGLLRVGDHVTIDLLRDGRRERRRAVLANTLANTPVKAPALRRQRGGHGHRH